MNKEIEIPEGCEAKIVGNKVVFVPKESEDERIRKEIVGFIDNVLKDKNVLLLVADRIGDNIPSMIPGWIAYLERQKDEAQKQFNLGIQAGKEEALYEMKPLSTEEIELNSIAFLEQLGYTCVPPGAEQKPAEWSEEDEQYLLVCKNALNKYQRSDHWDATIILTWLENRLKSLRPQPKQGWSKKDKGALEDAVCATDILGNDESFNKSNPNLAKAFRVAKVWLKTLPERFDIQPKQGWSEEDEGLIDLAVAAVEDFYDKKNPIRVEIINFLHSIRPQPKQESEPLEIKYAGKIYKVYETKELPGGVVGYIIEDEPGHYDCIIQPDEVLGGGYGIKSNGSPYPTKEANFDQPHWKPSVEQMKYLDVAIAEANGHKSYNLADGLVKLKDDLEKL